MTAWRVTAALGLLVAPWSALAQSPAPLEVIAPDGCVDPASLRAELMRAGVDVTPTAPWRGRVVARRTAPSLWLLTVDVTAERATHDARTADRCEGLPELAALLVRNALPPRRDDAPRAPPSPLPRRVGVAASLGGGISFGMLAPVSPGLLAAVGVVVGPWRGELGFGWFAPQGSAGSTTDPRVEAVNGTLRGCFAPGGDARSLRFDLCLALDVGAIGEVFGASDPSLPIARRSLWIAAQAGARITWRPTATLGLWADAGLRAMILNPPPALVTDAAGGSCAAHRCLDPVSSWVQPALAVGLEVRIR